jgi:hypothetical protein
MEVEKFCFEAMEMAIGMRGVSKTPLYSLDNKN